MSATAKILPFKTPNQTGHPAPSSACREAVRESKSKRIELTVQLILDIKPTGAEKDFLWDSIVRGFGAYKTDTGICSYLVKRGNFRRVLGQVDDAKWPASPAANIKAARAEAFDLIRKFEAGEAISKRAQENAAKAALTPFDALTVKAACDIYLAKKRSKAKKLLRLSSKDTYARGVEKLKDWWDRELWSITKDECDKLADKLWEMGRNGHEKAGSRVRTVLGLFNSVWRYHAAIDPKPRPMSPTIVLTANNKWPSKKRRKRQLGATNPQERDETATWWAALEEMTKLTNRYGNPWWDPRWVVFFRALLLTGGRRSEVHYAEWKHIDFANKVWFFPGEVKAQEGHLFTGNKSGRDHWVYMGPYLAKMMKAYRDTQPKDNRYVFGDALDLIKADDPSHAITQMLKVFAGKLRKWSCHDMRRTFLSVTSSKDLREVVPLKIMKMLVNHESENVDVTLGYIQADPDDLRHYSKMIEAAILKRAGVKS